AARQDCACRGGDRAHRRRAFGAEVKSCGDRVRAGLLRCLHRPDDLAVCELLRSQVGLLIEDDGAVNVLFEAGSPAVHPLGLFLAVAAPDLRRSHDYPAIAVEWPGLKAQVCVNEEHADDALAALDVDGDLRLLPRLEA